MRIKDLVKRYTLLGLGLSVMAFGIAFSIKADLGTSPISSVPYVLSLITPLSVGMLTIIMHCTFVGLQILLLRKNYDPIQLLQLAVAFVFGFMTDFALGFLRDVTYSSYAQQWGLCILGIVLVGFGVSCEVAAGVVTVAGEGLVIAITKVFPIKFSNMKIIFDVSLVVTALVLSFIFLRGLYGIREGTLAAAVCVGMVSKVFVNPLKKLVV